MLHSEARLAEADGYCRHPVSKGNQEISRVSFPVSARTVSSGASPVARAAGAKFTVLAYGLQARLLGLPEWYWPEGCTSCEGI